MTRSDILRAYVSEPVLAGLVCSLFINVYGTTKNAEFMHSEARDILSLTLVLLAASIALWAGLFFMTTTDFGKWLDSKGMTETINNAYIASTVIFLTGSVVSIVCAYVGPQIRAVQIAGEFFSLWSLAVVLPMLNNTRHLLKLHALHRKLLRTVTDIRPPLQETNERRS